MGVVLHQRAGLEMLRLHDLHMPKLRAACVVTMQLLPRILADAHNRQMIVGRDTRNALWNISADARRRTQTAVHNHRAPRYCKRVRVPAPIAVALLLRWSCHP